MGSSATLGGSGAVLNPSAEYEDWQLDFGCGGAGGVPTAFQTGGTGNQTQLVGPSGDLSTQGTGTFNGANTNGVVIDNNNRVCIQLAGGLAAATINGGAFGFNRGMVPQLLKPTSIVAVSPVPVDQQGFMVDWWVQFGPLGVAPNRGDVGCTFETGNVTVPDVNCIHNVNTGGAGQTGSPTGFGLLYFADGNLHFFSNTLSTGSTPGVNQIIGPPPADICRITYVISNATVSSNALLTVYINRVPVYSASWATGGGHPLSLYSDVGALGSAAFRAQAIAAPPGQDAQAFTSSGLVVNGYRYRKGPLAQILAGL